MKLFFLLLINLYGTLIVGYAGDGITVGFGDDVGIGVGSGNFNGVGSGLGGIGHISSSTGDHPRSSSIANSNAISLGLCSDFVLVVGAKLVSLGGEPSEALTGSVGLGLNATFVGNFPLLDGTFQNNTANVIQCTTQINIASQKLSNATCTTSNTFNNSDLAGQTLLPGVYCSSGTFIHSNGIVTFDGQNIAGAQWIFQTSTYIKTFSRTHFKLINGAIATNIYWNVGSYIELGANSNFVGNIFTKTNVSFNDSISYVGRAFAKEVYFSGGSVLAMPVNPLSNAPTLAPVSTPPPRAKSSRPSVPMIIGIVSGAIIFCVMAVSLFCIFGLRKKHYSFGPLSPRQKIRYNDRVLSTYETNKKKLEANRIIDSETKDGMVGPFSVGLNPVSEPLTIYNPESQEVTEIIFEN